MARGGDRGGRSAVRSVARVCPPRPGRGRAHRAPVGCGAARACPPRAPDLSTWPALGATSGPAGGSCTTNRTSPRFACLLPRQPARRAFGRSRRTDCRARPAELDDGSWRRLLARGRSWEQSDDHAPCPRLPDALSRDRPRHGLAAGRHVHALAARARLVGDVPGDRRRQRATDTGTGCDSSGSRPTSAARRRRESPRPATSISRCSRSGSRPRACFRSCARSLPETRVIDRLDRRALPARGAAPARSRGATRRRIRRRAGVRAQRLPGGRRGAHRLVARGAGSWATSSGQQRIHDIPAGHSGAALADPFERAQRDRLHRQLPPPAERRSGRVPVPRRRSAPRPGSPRRASRGRDRQPARRQRRRARPTGCRT